jgi:para-nitrobenzyl esterase
VVQVRTECGVVVGVEDRGAIRFRSIPFAAPPFGANRFQAPQPAAKWDGVRDTSEFGVGAPQPRWPGDPFDAYFNPPRQGDDCLTLDIWTPDPGTSGLPVMVWIHGGGLMTGTGSAPAHDGYTFARDGIVHVGINYRLGIDGFAHFADGPDNLGLRDQLAALDWVQRNIAAFGGDPSRVTVFGQSGGAIAVLDLLAVPSARGLFSQAMVMSGSPIASVDPNTALRLTARLAERFDISPTRDAFAAVPLERTIAEILPMTLEFIDPTQWGAESLMVSPWRAVHGTELLPESPLDAAGWSDVPIMIGTLRNETTGFLATMGILDDLPASTGQLMLQLMGVDGDILSAYRVGPRGLRDTRSLVEASWTDWAFRIPSLELAEARTTPTHVYEFRWESPMFPPGLGANHAIEVPFMRDDLAALLEIGAAGEALIGRDAPEALAKRMHRAFVDYARGGNPGWAAYTPDSRITKVFDTVDTVQDDPAAPERQAWEARP